MPTLRSKKQPKKEAISPNVSMCVISNSVAKYNAKNYLLGFERGISRYIKQNDALQEALLTLFGDVYAIPPYINSLFIISV